MALSSSVVSYVWPGATDIEAEFLDAAYAILRRRDAIAGRCVNSSVFGDSGTYSALRAKHGGASPRMAALLERYPAYFLAERDRLEGAGGCRRYGFTALAPQRATATGSRATGVGNDVGHDPATEPLVERRRSRGNRRETSKTRDRPRDASLPRERARSNSRSR